MSRRIVVTGIGAVTPLGGSAEDSWLNIKNGISGVRKMSPEQLEKTKGLECKVIAPVVTKNEDPLLGVNLEEMMDPRLIKRTDRFIHFIVVAANFAIADSGIDTDDELTQDSTGVIIGSGVGGFISIERNFDILKTGGVRSISPFFIQGSLVNLGSGFVSIQHKLRGPSYSVVSACATGAHAIGEGARIIMTGDADIMVCGGSEAAICDLCLGGFGAIRVLATKFNDEPKKASRPWDKERSGFVMGEGAGVMVLEELEHAKNRDAHIYAELVGYGATCDAHHSTAPDPTGNGGLRAMQIALRKASLTPFDIDYINAHGTSTGAGDAIEIEMIKKLFVGYDITKVAMSSTKSAMGHLLGAAGGVEAILSILAMRDGVAPPTLNLDDPDDCCSPINLVPHHAISKKIDVVMSNSFGFGGTNASLVFKKYVK